MEKPLFLAEKPSPNLFPRHRGDRFDAHQSIMVFDFSKTCKTYEAKSYKKEDFIWTHCPGCPAVGRFKLYGSYYRHAIYFGGSELIYEYMEIKRIMCLSCKATHAVMPGDIIPYKLLTLFVLLLILGLVYLEKTPVLKIAEAWKFSHQFIYSAIAAFLMHAARIYLYFKEASRGAIPHGLGDAGIVALIKKTYAIFQSGYLGSYKRPCFMCKFFDRPGAPPTGQMAPLQPPGGLQHNP